MAIDAFEYDNLLVFEVGNQKFAFNVLFVKEVIPACEVVKLPVEITFISGLIENRSQYIPVLQFAEKFKFTASPTRNKKYIVVDVISLEGEQSVAVVVDKVLGVVEQRHIDIKPLPNLNGTLKKYLDGFFYHNEQSITILRTNMLMENEEILLLETLKEAYGA